LPIQNIYNEHVLCFQTAENLFIYIYQCVNSTDTISVCIDLKHANALYIFLISTRVQNVLWCTTLRQAREKLT
jgi:hypothetical protein